MAAQFQMADRRPRQIKFVRHGQLHETVEDRIKTRWAPERIAGRTRLEGARPESFEETITPYLLQLRHAFRIVIAPSKPPDVPPLASGKKAPYVQLRREVSILFRPVAVAHRTVFGD